MSNETTEYRSLGAVGPRGLVLHAKSEENGVYAYYPDDENDTWRQERFRVKNLSAFAKAHDFDPRDLETLIKFKAPVAVVPPDGSKRVVLVNLDAFQDLNAVEPAEEKRLDPGPKGNGKLPPTFESVLVQEHGKWYAVPENVFRSLDAQDAGEARVLVRRGTVAAAVPNNNLPIGTNCVLVNLTEVLPR